MQGKHEATALRDYSIAGIKNRRFGEAIVFIHTMHAMDIHYPAPRDNAPIERAFTLHVLR